MHFQNVQQGQVNKLWESHSIQQEVLLYLPTKTELHFRYYLNLRKIRTLCSFCGKTTLRLKKHRKLMICVLVGISTTLLTKVVSILQNGSGQKHCTCCCLLYTS